MEQAHFSIPRLKPVYHGLRPTRHCLIIGKYYSTWSQVVQYGDLLNTMHKILKQCGGNLHMPGRGKHQSLFLRVKHSAFSQNEWNDFKFDRVCVASQENPFGEWLRRTPCIAFTSPEWVNLILVVSLGYCGVSVGVLEYRSRSTWILNSVLRWLRRMTWLFPLLTMVYQWDF